MHNNVSGTDHLSSASLSASPELTPRTLVIELLAVSGSFSLSTPALTLGGELMGFTAGAIRVAISRLAGEGLIESPRWGEWDLVRNAPWIQEQARWQRLASLTKAWNGHWWLAICNQVPRSRRGAWRTHERALLHRGFREVERDIFLRPANLNHSFQSLKNDLVQLGTQEATHIVEATNSTLQPDPALWLCAQRSQALADVLVEMKTLLNKKGSDIEQSCREFLLVGRHAARLLNNDPLLPEEWAGPSPRQDVVALMPAFVDAGQAAWRRFLAKR